MNAEELMATVIFFTILPLYGIAFDQSSPWWSRWIIAPVLAVVAWNFAQWAATL